MATGDCVPTYTMEPTSKTVAVGTSKSIIAICGNSSALPSFSQCITSPPDSDRKGRSDTDGAFHADLALHNVNHSFHKGQPESVALRGVRAVALIELFKNMRPHVRAHAASRVGYFYGSVRAVSRQRQRYPSAVLGKLKGVGKKIIPNKQKQLCIYDKLSATFLNDKDGEIENDMDGLLPFKFHCTYMVGKESYMMQQVSAEEMQEALLASDNPKHKDWGEKMKFDDNDILVLAKLKK